MLLKQRMDRFAQARAEDIRAKRNRLTVEVQKLVAATFRTRKKDTR
jgi:hypothetical protein